MHKSLVVIGAGLVLAVSGGIGVATTSDPTGTPRAGSVARVVPDSGLDLEASIASLQVVEGELVGSANDLGDGVDANDVAFGTTFPYLALPASGSDADPHPSAGGAAKQSADKGGLLEQVVPGRKSSVAFIGVGLLALVGGIGGAVRRTKQD